LAHALTKNRTLRTLSLEWNSLGLFPEGFRALSATLALPSSTLTSLDFRNNRLTADAGTSIANALNTNRSVNTLDLRWNSLGKRAKCCVSLLCVLVVCHCGVKCGVKCGAIFVPMWWSTTLSLASVGTLVVH
jgi:hypothetical protein